MSSRKEWALLVFVALISICGIGAQSCPNGWTTYDDSCYVFVHDSKDFTEAEHYCRHHASHLVHIESAQENNFLKSFASDLKDAAHWIGLNDVVIEGEWVWSDTDTITQFTDWEPGQPNEGKAANCVVFAHGGYTWADRRCSDNYQFICEKSQNTGGEIVG